MTARRETAPVSALYELEAGRTLLGYGKRSFHRHARAHDRPFVEELTDQRDAVRHAARRRELGQRIIRIRRPVASRFRHLHESGAQRERWLTSEVRNCKDLVPQGWHEQEVFHERQRLADPHSRRR